ncbi:MAG: TRAP transporter TatT component family protein [Elusimicrobiota bacterium]
MRKRTWLVAFCLPIWGCASFDRIALRSNEVILERGRVAVLDEPDLQLGRDAMASQLKLLDILLASDPASLTLRRLAAESFSGYAFLFVEDADPQRAKNLYRRGRDHALAALALSPAFRGLPGMTLENLEKALTSASKKDVPELFWAAFAWGGVINASKDDAAELAELPKVAALMKRVYALDPAFHFGGSDLFFGVYYASRPPLLGGNPAKSKTHFDWAHRITKGQYLMAHVLNARWYAVAVQDRALFTQLLTKVLESPAGLLPEARLSDEAAKKKAAALLEKIDDYF